MLSDRPVRIVIADDHAMFRQGVLRLFAAVDNVDVIADADNGDDLIKLIEQHQPDVAIVDISMPGPGATGIVEQVEKSSVDCKLIALTMHMEPSYAHELLRLGMSAYVIKDAAFDELLEAIDSVIEDEQYLSRQIVESSNQEPALTERELQCLRYTARGETGKHIARLLDISERTVRFHLSNACRKLGVQRRSQAVAVAIQRKLIVERNS